MPVKIFEKQLEIEDFIYPGHLRFFLDAAVQFKCDILVRKTGRSAISWIGKSGFTGKRADMKAKTADVDCDARAVAGLVCSPIERPQVFSAERLGKAWKEWGKSEHLITVPERNRGFDDDVLPRYCRTPYILQNNPNHRYYGAIALVEMGLLRPHYVHGDYDLYDIFNVAAGKRLEKDALKPRGGYGYLDSTVNRSDAGLKQKVNARVKNLESELSFRVANTINTGIAMSGNDILGALMVNHGEQVLLGMEGVSFEPVLAVLSEREDGQYTRILKNEEDHNAYYGSRVG